MTMIEQVARAICRNAMFSAGSTDTRARDEMVEGCWKYYTEAACAAITAMREPTDQMGNALNRMGRPYDAGSHSATEIWQALIDAALEEGE